MRTRRPFEWAESNDGNHFLLHDGKQVFSIVELKRYDQITTFECSHSKAVFLKFEDAKQDAEQWANNA